MNRTQHLNKIPLLNWAILYSPHVARSPLNAICQNKPKVDDLSLPKGEASVVLIEKCKTKPICALFHQNSKVVKKTKPNGHTNYENTKRTQTKYPTHEKRNEPKIDR